MKNAFSSKDLSEDALNLIAARFKALSEPNRLKLIIALQPSAQSVTGLIEATGLKQANVSRHLQTLTEAGILARRRQGPGVVYCIADPGIFDLCHLVCGGIQKRLRRQTEGFAGY